MTSEWMKEDKQQICDQLCTALQKTRAAHDLQCIAYDAEKETCTLCFWNQNTVTVNVAQDSGSAMIRDIMRKIG